MCPAQHVLGLGPGHPLQTQQETVCPLATPILASRAPLKLSLLVVVLGSLGSCQSPVRHKRV